jgi:hypothetical protein
MQKLAFEQTELSSEEFYFGDPAAWIFDNLWAMEEPSSHTPGHSN